MNNQRRSRIMTILLIVIVLGGLGYYFYTRQSAQSAGTLSASGTIEATQIQIAAEVSGKVMEVLVDEGDSFKAGDTLFRLDDTVLKTQREQTAAALQMAKDNLTAAQAGLDTANAALLTAQANNEVAKANNQADLIHAKQSLQDLYDNSPSAKAAAATALATANHAVRDAQYNLDNFSIPSDQQGMTPQQGLDATKAKLDAARAAFEPYKYYPENDETRKDLFDKLGDAQSAYDTAVRRIELETALEKAQAAVEKSTRDLQAVQDGPKTEDIAQLQARITALQALPKQLDAAVAQAQTGISQAQAKLDQARSSVDQAQAALDAVDLQLSKVIVTAPASGVLLSRGIEPGELVQAGATVMSIGELDTVDITVYIPEDLYGRIKLGQTAALTVDSFPGKVFEAKVVNISDKAEFTPRNVQTVEGRKTTVYAVKLSTPNPDMLLKVGMPADVNFNQ